jgi:phosphoribosylformylglycinamidine cyclo-ligase
MYRTFNMGVGMVIIAAPADAPAILAHVRARDEQCYQIGRVGEGRREVLIT